MTEKPVYSVQSPLYTIELKSRFDLSGLINGQDFFSLTIEDGEKITEYSGCSVESAGQHILPNKLTEYTAVISAADEPRPRETGMEVLPKRIDTPPSSRMPQRSSTRR